MHFKVGCLAALSVSGLYSVDGRTTNEYEAVAEMRIGREN
jgi:hypothetical protein